MKLKRPKILALGAFLSVLFVMAQVFTNCSKQGGYTEGVQSLTLGPDHPPVTVLKSFAKYSAPLGHKQFIASIISENFSTSESSVGYVGGLKSLVKEWATDQGSQLGLACNPYESPSGNDCSGNINNANSALLRPSTPIREALRIHLCDEILGNDEAVTAALKNAQVTAPMPDHDSIVQIAGLFFRGDSPSPDFIDLITEMDQHLNLENTKTFDRWRLILVEICESTEWQRL